MASLFRSCCRHFQTVHHLSSLPVLATKSTTFYSLPAFSTPRLFSRNLSSDTLFSSQTALSHPSPYHNTPRAFLSTSGSGGATNSKPVRITWQYHDGRKVDTTANTGETLLTVAKRHDIDLEGACEGSCACSTCHVILDESVFSRLPEPQEKEEDMLDLAFGLTRTSRLGCQVKVEPWMDNIIVKLPAATRNMAVDGFKSKH